MKKIFTTLLLSIVVTTMFAQKNAIPLADQDPMLNEVNHSSSFDKALWNIHFNYDLTTETSGDVGMAASLFFNNEFWVSRWASDTIYRFNSTGGLINEFVIVGLTGTRSFTTDGTYIYAGTSSNTIYRIDPTTQTLSAPNITSSAPVSSRFLTYDSTLNAGAGGFWTGNFNTDIVSISMTGAVLSTIPSATHTLTGMYGAAVDNFTNGGPFLWVFNQGGSNNCQLSQILLATGMPTGLTHDVMSDVGAAQSLSSGLAGGMFISNEIVLGQVTIGGMIQGTPNNILFGYELSEPSPVGLKEVTNSFVSIYPNPTNEILTIKLSLEEKNVTYKLVDLTGKVILKGSLSNNLNKVDVSMIASGSYILEIESSDKIIEKQLILKN